MLEEKFFSENIINLSQMNLSDPEIVLQFKDINFISSGNKVGSVTLKRELKEDGKNSGWWGILETMKAHSHMRNKGLIQTND